MMKQMRKIIRRNEFMRQTFRSAYRFTKYHTAKTLSRVRGNKLDILYVNPLAISHTIALNDPSLTASAVRHIGTVSRGDWDLNGLPVQQYGNIFTILKRRILEQKPYKDISEFQKNISRIEQGELIDSATTPEEYLLRWKSIEALYYDIQENGYRIQAELGTQDHLDEIKIQIGRRGEMLFEEGLHRLAIAQLIPLEKIPVIVSRRHIEWEALRQDLIKIVMQRGFFHQPFNHPDLDSIPYIYGNQLKDQAMYGHERWEFIRESLPFQSGRVLDIGSYFGYFVHRFEEFGFDCYAVEPDRENLAVLKRYRDIKDKNFTIWEKSVFELKQFDFDIVLALNIFHHLVKRKQDYEQLAQFLKKLRCQAMYFEPHQNLDLGAYKRFTDEQFIEFVTSNSVLNHAQLLGCSREQRNVYLLTV